MHVVAVQNEDAFGHVLTAPSNPSSSVSSNEDRFHVLQVVVCLQVAPARCLQLLRVTQSAEIVGRDQLPAAARTRLRFFQQVLIGGFDDPLHNMLRPKASSSCCKRHRPPLAAIAGISHVDVETAPCETSPSEYFGTRPFRDGEVSFLSIPFHLLCYSNVTPSTC